MIRYVHDDTRRSKDIYVYLYNLVKNGLVAVTWLNKTQAKNQTFYLFGLIRKTDSPSFVLCSKTKDNISYLNEVVKGLVRVCYC